MEEGHCTSLLRRHRTGAGPAEPSPCAEPDKGWGRTKPAYHEATAWRALAPPSEGGWRSPAARALALILKMFLFFID